MLPRLRVVDASAAVWLSVMHHLVDSPAQTLELKDLLALARCSKHIAVVWGMVAWNLVNQTLTRCFASRVSTCRTASLRTRIAVVAALNVRTTVP